MTKQKKSIPKNAKRVFRGEIFEVWQWQQKMFDGTTETFEKVKRPDTLQIIPVVGRKILIEKQEQPGHSQFLSLAGGRRDNNESPLQAAKRELLEETGYSSKDWLLFQKEYQLGHVVFTIYTYIARNCFKKNNPNLDSGERITTKFVNFNQFLALSDNKLFRNHDFVNTLLRIKMDSKRKKQFQNLLFKK